MRFHILEQRLLLHLTAQHLEICRSKRSGIVVVESPVRGSQDFFGGVARGRTGVFEKHLLCRQPILRLLPLLGAVHLVLPPDSSHTGLGRPKGLLHPP